MGTRDRVLDAAAAELLARPGSRLRMSAVAARAGTSRQTVYAYFPGPRELAAALVVRLTADFLGGVEEVMAAAADTPARWAAAVAYTLERAAGDPLLRAMLGGDPEYVQLLTTGEATVVVATEHVAAIVLRHEPGLDAGRVRAAAETAVRLAVSHLLLPLHPRPATVGTICAAVAGVLSG